MAGTSGESGWKNWVGAGVVALGLSGAPVKIDLSTLEVSGAQAMAGPREISRAQQELFARRLYDVLKQRKASSSRQFDALAAEWKRLPTPKTKLERQYTSSIVIGTRDREWAGIISGIPSLSGATSVEVRAFKSEKDSRVWLGFAAKDGNEEICDFSFADNEPTLLPVK